MQRRWRTRFSLPVVGVIAGLLLVGCSTSGGKNQPVTQQQGSPAQQGSASQSTALPAVVFTYDGKQVSRTDFEKEIKLEVQLGYPQDIPMSVQDQANFAAQYAQLLVINDQAPKLKINPTSQQIDQTYQGLNNLLVQQVYGGDQQQFQNRMKQLGLTTNDLKRLAKQYTVFNTYIQQQAQAYHPSEKELQDYYNQHKENLTTVDVAHILVTSQQQAEQVKQQLDQGKDFAALAKQYSTDTATKDQGGVMTGVPLNQLVKPFADAAFTAPLGKVVGPVQSQYGYHLIRVDKRTTPNFDSAKAQITQTLQQQHAAQQADKLVAQANVHYNLAQQPQTQSQG
ncbi:MAG: peptidylprolyl isomerase [Firmicutes bacterium]|nr:peptidylprolyl isomerase [Bacillota bacterium]